MQKIIGIVFALSFALTACGNSPLVVPTVRETGPSDPSPSAPVATATATQTSTQPTITDTSTATNTATQTATATTASIPTVTATATATMTQTAAVEPTECLPLYIKQADDCPTSRVITANTNDNTLARLVFYGADEPVRVTGLPVEVFGCNYVADVMKLRVFDADSKMFCDGAIDKQGLMYCRSDYGFFTVDGTAEIAIKANIEQISPGWAQSGDIINGNIMIELSIPPTERLFRAYGLNSGRSYCLIVDDRGTGTAVKIIAMGGYPMTIRKSQPMIAAVAISPDLVNGENVVSKHSYTASTNGDVGQRRFTLLRSVSRMYDSSFKYGSYRIFENGTEIDSSLYTIAINPYSNYAETVTVDFLKEETLEAGTTKTYEVRMTVSGVKAEDFVTHRLLGDDEKSQNFLWSDNSADDHSLTSPDWWSGYGVSGLPSLDQVLSI